ncbi:MAG: hypothetical protein ACLVAT_05220 [Lachnospiraceae bacterium]
MTSEDETAGVATTQYLVSPKALSRADLEKNGPTGPDILLRFLWQQISIWWYTKKVVDKAGNIEFFSTDGIIVDNTRPDTDGNNHTDHSGMG